MADRYRVTLSSDLVEDIESRSEADQDAMLAFVMMLRADGFDVIAGAKAVEVDGLDVEFIEPGETPEMVWARFFLFLDQTSITIFARQKPDRLILDIA